LTILKTHFERMTQLKLPGYRSKNRWKMTLATLVYSALVFLIGFGILNSDLSYREPDVGNNTGKTAEGAIQPDDGMKTGGDEAGGPPRNQEDEVIPGKDETGADYGGGKAAPAKDGKLIIHYIDVGQADSILIITPGKKVMLIDAGNNNDGDDVVEYLRNQGISRIDVAVGTHPHEDHIGGLDTVIRNFDIGKIYMPKAVNATKTFEDVLAAVKDKGLKINTAEGGRDIAIDSRIESLFLAPNSGEYKDLNNYSAVVKLTFGETSFLFAGDAEDVSEEEMLQKGYDLKADVLKVGHHGSSSSTTPEFLEEVDPEYAVIMTGKDNEYGHPHKEVMERLKNKGIKVYRTDQNGTVVVESDGRNITFSTKPGDYTYPEKG
jgi:competence protein ComEC